MLFSASLAKVEGPVSVLQISPDWAQGRATFGGLIAAQVYQAMNCLVKPDRPVRSLHITFAAPVVPDEISVAAKIVRDGKAVTVTEGHCIQEGELKVLLSGSFGSMRQSEIVAPPLPMPDIPDREEGKLLRYVAGLTPEFIQHFHYNFLFGGLPFSNTKSREMGGWVKFADPEPEITIGHLLALIDAWPPATLPWLSKPAAASTLTWNIQFLQPLPTLSGSAEYLYHALIEEAADGYAFTHARLWNEEGQLLALSQQTVAVFG